MCTERTSQARSAKSLAAGVQGPLKGPGSSGVLDALWCNLSLILGAFYPINLFIYFYNFFFPTQLERESGRFGKIRLKAGDLPLWLESLLLTSQNPAEEISQ